LPDLEKSFIRSTCINGAEQGDLMKLLSYVILSALLLSLGAPLVGAQEAAEAWGDPVAEGIEYREYQLPDPVNVFVTRMDRSNLQVTLESSIGQGRLSGGGETVSSMAQRYDGALNYWDQTWGNTNQVAVAINGFYFGPPFEPAGVPWSGQVHSGWFSKRFTELQSGSGFAWNLDRSAFIGECVEQPDNKQQVTLYRNDSDIGSLGFDDINVSRKSNEFILYTPQYSVDTGTTGSSDSIEVLVQLKRPSLIIPYGDMAAAEKGEIVKILNNKGSTAIPFDHVVLSLHGSKKDDFLSMGIQAGELGDKVGISQKVKDCLAFPQNNWDYTYASIGGAFYFLKGGVVQDFSSDPQANVRDPRTAIVFNDDYIYFIVVDGRDELNSIGMTIPQLANFAKDELGATYGIAQDGGGSSTMVVNGEVKNNTYCNIVICKNRYFLPFVTKSGSSLQSGQFGPQEGSLQFAPASTPDPVERLSGDGLPLTEEYYTYNQDATGAILQRLVANGMMMVVVEPKDLSPIFTENETIKTLTQVDVRLGPGTNYGLIETVDAGTTGIIYGKDNGLNGVWAKGYYWWHVLLEIDGRDVIGWVIEPALTKVLQ
jgi:hypothetical protein